MKDIIKELPENIIEELYDFGTLRMDIHTYLTTLYILENNPDEFDGEDKIDLEVSLYNINRILEKYNKRKA